MRKGIEWLADTSWLAGASVAAWCAWLSEQGLDIHMAP